MKAMFAQCALVGAGLIMLQACSQSPTASPASAVQAKSILTSSTPSPGSTVAAPVDQLVLRFDPPARLNEVTVTAQDGTSTPMMVTAAGEVDRYTIPLPGLGSGRYTVAWKASVAGTAHQSSFDFVVR